MESVFLLEDTHTHTTMTNHSHGIKFVYLATHTYLK